MTIAIRLPGTGQPPKIPDPDGHAHPACASCRRRTRDVMLTLDRGELIDLCRTCARSRSHARAEADLRRRALLELAASWARGHDDYGRAGELLQRTGLDLDARWDAWRDLVGALRRGADAGPAVDVLAGAR